MGSGQSLSNPRRVTVMEVLRETSGGNVDARKAFEVVGLDAGMTARQALSRLARSGYSSAPVLSHGAQLVGEEKDAFQVDAPVKARDAHQLPASEVIGMFDVPGFIRTVFVRFQTEDAGIRIIEKMSKSEKIVSGAELLDRPVSEVTTLAGSKKAFTITPLETLDQVVRKMAKLKLHRCFVVDPERQTLLGMVTQSTILKWVREHRRDTRSLEKLNIGLRRVTSVLATDSAVTALHTMIDRGLNGIAVVDAKGIFVCSLGSEILRGFTEDTYVDFTMPVVDFVHKYAKMSHMTSADIVTGKTPFSHCVDTMILHKLHRLWIVDNMHQPIGVLTLGDIVQRLANETELEYGNRELILQHDEEKVKPKKISKKESQEQVKRQRALSVYNASSLGKLGMDSPSKQAKSNIADDEEDTEVIASTSDEENAPAKTEAETTPQTKIEAVAQPATQSPKPAPETTEPEKPPTPALPAPSHKKHRRRNSTGEKRNSHHKKHMSEADRKLTALPERASEAVEETRRSQEFGTPEERRKPMAPAPERKASPAHKSVEKPAEKPAEKLVEKPAVEKLVDEIPVSTSSADGKPAKKRDQGKHTKGERALAALVMSTASSVHHKKEVVLESQGQNVKSPPAQVGPKQVVPKSAIAPLLVANPVDKDVSREIETPMTKRLNDDLMDSIRHE